MIYDIVEFFVDPIMWFLFSKEGSEWMPFIFFIGGIWVASIAIWLWWPRRPQ